VHAEADGELKARAPASGDVEGEWAGKTWKEDAGLMELLCAR
jgi:hypothetical protein